MNQQPFNPNINQNSNANSGQWPANPETGNRQHFLEAARDIGLLLASKAIWDDDGKGPARCNWLGAAIEPVEGQYKVVTRTFAADMYNGTSGIAYFLAQLYPLVQEETIKTTLEGAVNQFISLYDRGRMPLNFSFYAGKVGLAYTLVIAGQSLQREEWYKKSLEILRSLEKEELTDAEIDVISGAAGSIPALLKLHAFFPNEHFIKELAIKCGDFLVKKAEHSAQGASWNVMPGKHNLTGYSHGAAGAASALMELAANTQNETYMELAHKGFEYERHFFDTQQQNWYDLRDDSFNQQSNSYPCGMAWCHGAPGIALSRLKAYRLTRMEGYLKQTIIAMETTQRSIAQAVNMGMNSGVSVNAGENFSLCHGLAGNADVLIEGAAALNRPDLLQQAEALGNYGIQKYGKYNVPWPSGVNDLTGRENNQETPGLLLGLAGTGYFYLRLFLPGRMENILGL